MTVQWYLLVSIISFVPNLHRARLFTGVCYRTLGRVYEAEHQFKLALALNPLYYSAVFNLGLTYQHLNRWDEAIAHFRRVTQVWHILYILYVYYVHIVSTQSQLRECYITCCWCCATIVTCA